MELTTDSEKRRLIKVESEPLTWTSPSESDFSDESSNMDDLWEPESLCQQFDTMSREETTTRQLARKKLLAACVVSLIFMTGEVIGGYAAHSLAIMTDAVHLLSDCGSIMISIFSLWISSRPPTQSMSFGWHRAEILGMFLSVVSIWAVSAGLVLSAIQRITDGDYEIDGHIMLITSACAVLVNVLMVLILHQSGSAHGHSHSNASVKAAFVHVVGDFVQSVGILMAAIVIHFWPEYKVADPICTFLFSILVLGTTLPVTKDVFRILMQGVPSDVSFSSVRELLLSVRGVDHVHNVHVWSLNLNHSLLSAHLVTEEGADSQLVLIKATKLLRSKFSFSSVTIQVERFRKTIENTSTEVKPGEFSRLHPPPAVHASD